jgi:hypothetical protein
MFANGLRVKKAPDVPGLPVTSKGESLEGT